MKSSPTTWCRHCGRAGESTREHIPPASTGNTEPVQRIDDPFDSEAVLSEVAEWSEGHVVRTLDTVCNNRASRWGYVAEYRRWHEVFVAEARRLAGETGSDPLRGPGIVDIDLPYDVQPARFVRQVIGMFLAVQQQEHLLAGHQSLVSLIGGDPADETRRRSDGLAIAPLRLYMSVCNSRWSYLTQAMAAIEFPLTREPRAIWTPAGTCARSSEMYLLALAPFMFVLTDREDSDHGVDVSHWAGWTVDQRPGRTERHLSLPTADRLSAGIRAMVYPADYAVPRDL